MILLIELTPVCIILYVSVQLSLSLSFSVSVKVSEPDRGGETTTGHGKDDAGGSTADD